MSVTWGPVLRKLPEGTSKFWFYFDSIDFELRNPTRATVTELAAAHFSRDRMAVADIHRVLGVHLLEGNIPVEVHAWAQEHDYIVWGYSISSPDDQTYVYSVTLRPVRRHAGTR